MGILAIYASFGVLLFILVFLPTIFCTCTYCNRKVLKRNIKLHKGSHTFMQSKNIYLCKKCCAKHGWESIKHYETFFRIKNKVELGIKDKLSDSNS